MTIFLHMVSQHTPCTLGDRLVGSGLRFPAEEDETPVLANQAYIDYDFIIMQSSRVAAYIRAVAKITLEDGWSTSKYSRMPQNSAGQGVPFLEVDGCSLLLAKVDVGNPG